METFEILPEHLTLLQNMYVGWQDCEYGAPEIDPKRPYGNSDVEGDILEILAGQRNTSKNLRKITIAGVEYKIGENGEISDNLRSELSRLHHETETALQLCLKFGEFKTGTFKRKNAWSEWERA